MGPQIAADVGLHAITRSDKYEDAIAAAKRYIALHPGTPDAAYAMYLVGASYFDQIPDVNRDQGRTERAIAALEEVIRKYPNTEYAASARRKIEGARDQLAAKEMSDRPLLREQARISSARSIASRSW